MQNSTNRLFVHIQIGVISCAFVTLVQSVIEILILSVWYSGFIFRPQDITKSPIFLLLWRLIHLEKHDSLPLFLDHYLGPTFIQKIPYFLTLIGTYALVGCIAGALLGIVLFLTGRILKKSVDMEGLFLLNLVLAVIFSLFANLAIEINLNYLTGISAMLRVTLTVVLLCALLFLAIPLYRAAKTVVNRRIENPERFVGLLKILRMAPVVLVPVSAALLLSNFWLAGSSVAAAVTQVPASMPASKSLSNTNVILISIDSLRSDHLGSYGYKKETSPNIDRIAADGILFENAFSVTSWTLPSHASMLTSVLPEANGLYCGHTRLHPGRTTLAEVLEKAGYETAGFVSGPLLDSRFGFDQGFKYYDDKSIGYKSNEESHHGITSPILDHAMQSWLMKNHRKKFFLFLHYWDVHYDYEPPAPYDKMFDPDYKGNIDASNYAKNKKISRKMDPKDLQHIVALYDGEIAFTDQHIGKLVSTLKEKGIYENTLIILTADHGEEFFEHGRKGHKRTLYDEVLRIPLIVKFPEGSPFGKGERLHGLVSLIDIMPTVFSYLNLKGPEQMQGKSLLGLMEGNNSPRQFVMATLEGRLFALRSANSKFIEHSDIPGKEYYDIESDPLEKMDLSRTPERRRDADQKLMLLLDLLNLQRRDFRSLPRVEGAMRIEMDESMKEELEGQGYLQ